MNWIRLRAHHLVCLQNFEGKGYSPDFVANMQRILDVLKLHPDNPCIQKTDKTDDLCRCCPFCNNGECNDLAKVTTLDRFYTTLFPEILSYNQLLKITHEHLKRNHFELACKHCEWFDICRKYMNKLRQ